MKSNPPFSAVLDTNVILPLLIRDLLFWLAFYELYIPKWSADVFVEWEIVMKRKGISDEEAKKRIRKANLAFPDALVQVNEKLINELILPDMADRHVLAAAIQSNAAYIITNNLKDFPVLYLNKYQIFAVSPDDFLLMLSQGFPDLVVMAFREMVRHKMKPKWDEKKVLDGLSRSGLIYSTVLLKKML